MIDPDTFGVEHQLNVRETAGGVFSIPLGETFGLEMKLETSSYCEEAAGLFLAIADFLDTASLEVSTETPDVVFEEVLAEPKLTIQGIKLVGSQIELTWESLPGRIYTIERTDQVFERWEVVSSDLEASPSPFNWTAATVDSLAAEPVEFFYRVREHPVP
jgi:hypothetical protein